MVKSSKLRNSRKALTFVEIIVTSMLMGIIFTGIMATMTITMKRISSTAQKENDEKQLDRFQVEVSHFVSRSADVQIKNDSGEDADSGNTLVCILQPDPLEPTPISQMKFVFQPSTAKRCSLRVEVTESNTLGGTAAPSTPSLVYTYSNRLNPISQPMFKRLPNGFIEYRWELDSGFGSESFNNIAVPRTSL
jgi:hypothetical protein